MEGDFRITSLLSNLNIFQSTPSVWRETHDDYIIAKEIPISIHSLRVEGDRRLQIPYNDSSSISIHSLRVEGDFSGSISFIPRMQFQSTPSVWRETSARDAWNTKQAISIHSLRVEGDESVIYLIVSIYHFNPLPPCGGRLDQ